MTDPHKQQRVTRDQYYRKTELTGRLFAVLDWAVDDRDLALMPHLSRAVRRGDILELVTTDEQKSGPGHTVHRVAYLGFVEAVEAGLLLSGDTVTLDKETIGVVVGFNETHMPNHLNVVLRVDARKTGREMDLKLDALVTFGGIQEERKKPIGFAQE